MPRIIASLVVGLLVLALGPMATAGQKDRIRREMRTDCQFDFISNRAWTPWEESLTGRCLVQKWPVSGGFPKLSAVIQCESGWYRYAYNPNGHVGLSQQDAGSWSYRLRAYEPPGWELKPAWWNPRSNLTVAVRMAHSSGWGAWTCA
jgi:hypothetical protein